MSQTLHGQLLSSLNETRKRLSNCTTKQKQGNKYYFTGKPCKHGHISERRITDNKCLECQRVLGRKRKQHLDPVHREKHKEWVEANREKTREYSRKSYALSDKQAHKNRCRNRRARLKEAEGFHTIEDILELSKVQTSCQICEEVFSNEKPYTVDHIIALANGGTNWPSNLQLLCHSCNSRKGVK